MATVEFQAVHYGAEEAPNTPYALLVTLSAGPPIAFTNGLLAVQRLQINISSAAVDHDDL